MRPFSTGTESLIFWTPNHPKHKTGYVKGRTKEATVGVHSHCGAHVGLGTAKTGPNVTRNRCIRAKKTTIKYHFADEAIK